jgi:mlo protein
MNFIAELMVLGFISLLLTFGQNYISKVCIPVKYSNTMLPCQPPSERTPDHPGEPALEPQGTEHEPTPNIPAGEGESKGEHHRRLLSYERRFLGGGGGGPGCKPVINLISIQSLIKGIFGEKQI